MSVKVETTPHVVDGTASKVKIASKTTNIVVAQKTTAPTESVVAQGQVALVSQESKIKAFRKNFNPNSIADKVIAGLIDKLNSGQGAAILNGSIGGGGSFSRLFRMPKFLNALEAAYNRQRQDALMAVKNLPFKSLYRNLDFIHKIFGNGFISNEFLLTKAIDDNESSDFINKMIEKYTGKNIAKLNLHKSDRGLHLSSGISIGAISAQIDRIEFAIKKEKKQEQKKEKLFGTTVISNEVKEKYGLDVADSAGKLNEGASDSKVKTFGLLVTDQSAREKDEKNLDKIETMMVKKHNSGASTNPFRA